MPRNTTMLHTVEPFEYSFVLINRRTGHRSYFSSLDSVLLASGWSTGFDRQPDYLPHRFSIHPRLNPYEKERAIFTGPLWHVCNHLGRPIEQHELEERVPYLPARECASWCRPTTFEVDPDGESRRFIRTKGSSAKIKAIHQHVRKNRWRGVYYATVCPLFRHVRTQNERRQTHNHFAEWGEYDRMARASRKKLPTYYDDTTVSARKGQKSWKHHSKRRKQWMAL